MQVDVTFNIASVCTARLLITGVSQDMLSSNKQNTTRDNRCATGKGFVCIRTGSMMWGFLVLITSTFSCREEIFLNSLSWTPNEQGAVVLSRTLPNHAHASISSGPTAGGTIVLRVCSCRPECVSMISCTFPAV